MKFENVKFAGLYDRQQNEAGYPGKLLPFVIDQLRDLSSVIDIGAGSGFFAIPLIKEGHPVTAVEPSRGMAEIMINKIRELDSSKLTVDIERWEDWNGAAHDASICIHSFYPLADRRHSLEKMLRFSHRRMIIIRNSREMRTVTGLVRQELKLHESPDLNDELLSMLGHLGVKYNVTEIREERDTVIHNIDDEVESIIFRTDADPGLHSRIRDIILENSISSGNIFVYKSRFCDNAYLF